MENSPDTKTKGHWFEWGRSTWFKQYYSHLLCCFFLFFLISIKLTFPCYSKIQPCRPPELKQKFSLLQLVFIYPRQYFDIQIRRKKALSTLWVIFKVLGHALNILDSFRTTPVKLDFVTPGLVYGRQDVNWLFNMSAGTGQACMKFK